MLRLIRCLLVVGWPWLYGQVEAQTIQFQHLSVEDGLSHNHVTAIVKDKRGFLWFGTPAGLNRYDGHEIKVFRHQAGQPRSLADNDILGLFLGPNDQLWIKTKLGINVYDDYREQFVRNGDSLLLTLGLPATDVLDIRRDPAGVCWFLQAGGLVSAYDDKRGLIASFPPAGNSSVTGIALDRSGVLWTVDQQGTVRKMEGGGAPLYQLRHDWEKGELADYRLFIDSRGHPWVYALNYSKGVYWWPQQGEPIHLSTGETEMSLSNPIVFGMAEDRDGNLWIATDHGGLNVVDPQSRRVTYLLHDEYNDRTVSQNSILSLYCDRERIMWAGTFKRGISYYHPSQIQFALYQRQRGRGNSVLPFDDINQFVEDDLGNVWIGSNGGGLIYFDRKTNRFTQYRHDPDNPYSIGSDVIVKLYIDRYGALWVGTYHGGLNRFDGGRFIRYVNDPEDPESIPDDSVWEIYEDSRGQFWVGTLKAGLAKFDRGTGRFTRLGFGENGLTRSSYISAITEDYLGQLWFGTASGIELLKPDGTVTLLSVRDGKPGSLSSDHVNEIIEDHQRRIWVATRDGLNLYDSRSGTFRAFRTEDGLSDNVVMAVVEDQTGTIWVSTSRGITAMRETDGAPGQWRFWNYDRRDGLQGHAFNEDAARLMSTGELFFGGPSGFNVVDPARIPSPPDVSIKPVLTDLQLTNRALDPSEWKHGRRLRLSHRQNTLGFVVASLYFLNKDRASFRYKLEGFDREWVAMDRRTRTATFTNLDPGNYRFRVMVSEDGENWSEPYTLATVTITPPVWKTGWAYAAYVLLLASAMLTVRHIERTREKTRFALQRERQEARSKLESVLKQKAYLEEVNKKKMDIIPSEQEITSADERFLRKALDTVEQRLGRSDFSVEDLAKAMNVSRVALYKRILTLTGHTPSEFIRTVRVRRGGQLLEQSGLTVSEIAYEVGFGNPKQFSKYFKQLYGVVPSAYRNNGVS